MDGVLSPTHFNLGEQFFAAVPGLRVVSQHAVGYNNIDVEAATRHGVAVCNTPTVLNAAVADLTMAIIISLARRLWEFEAFSRSGAWARREPLPPLAHEISGKVLGVIGFGRIGREVARRMQAIGMRIVWYDIFEGASTATIDDVEDAPYRPLDDLLRESDFVTIHTNLTADSYHLIGARELALMKPERLHREHRARPGDRPAGARRGPRGPARSPGRASTCSRRSRRTLTTRSCGCPT